MERQKIEFPKKNKPEFIVELRKSVKEYFESNNKSKHGNLELYFKTLFMFIMLLTPYFLMVFGLVNSLGGAFACWIIMGVGTAGMGMSVMHDANHLSYSKKQSVNRWMGKTLYLLGGFPANWQRQHNTMHHGFTNIDGHDEDIDPGPFLRFSPHKPLSKMHRYQHLYAWFLYGLMTLSWVINKDVTQLNGYRKEGVKMGSKWTYGQLFFFLVISKIIYFGAFIVIPVLVLPFAWYWIIPFFVLMHFTSGFILTVIFQTAHVVPEAEYPMPDEKGTMENNWAVHQLITTSDFAPKSRIFSWFIGGLNYQVEHHLFPNVSHVHYRNISGIVKSVADKYGLPYHVQPGFIRAVGEHARMLKKLGRHQVLLSEQP